MNHKDVAIRAGKTAIQTFVGVVVAALSNLFGIYNSAGLNGLKTAVIALVGSAVAAAISAAWNYWLQYNK